MNFKNINWNDFNEVLETVKQDWKGIKNASPELKKDKDICLEAIKNDWRALIYISEELQNNKNFLSEAIDTNIETFSNLIFINKDYLSDPKIIEATIDKFSKYECSKDFDLNTLKKYPLELKDILSNYNFKKESLILNNENKVQFGQ